MVTETNNFEKKPAKLFFLLNNVRKYDAPCQSLIKSLLIFQVSFEIAAFLWLSLWRKILWTNADQTSPFLHASERNYPSSLYRPDDGL